MPDALYTTKQTADTLGISVQRVKQLAVSLSVGRKVGRDWLFTDADLDALRARRTARGPAPHATTTSTSENDIIDSTKDRGTARTVPGMAPSVRSTRCVISLSIAISAINPSNTRNLTDLRQLGISTHTAALVVWSTTPNSYQAPVYLIACERTPTRLANVFAVVVAKLELQRRLIL